MALQLINVGTTSNDGTGDTLRTAGQKMNANASELFGLVADTQTALDTKLEAEALTDLTASDAAQDSAIAALILNDEAQDTLITGLVNDAVGLSGEIATLSASTAAALATKLEAAAIADFEPTAALNARDTANRARANHTGTQPANTVSGLATVATSGAYSDLSGPPAIPYGFTYDQQVEPAGPATGATWRERSAGGLILGEWEWLADFAEWVAIGSYDIMGLSLAGSGANSFTVKNFQSKKRLIQTVSLLVQTTSGTFDGSNFQTFTPLYQVNFSTTVLTASAAALVVNAPGTFTKTTAINSIYTFDTVRIFRGVTGAAGASSSAMTTKVRDVRQ
ncbi:hypothetical protein VB780_07225 [Leptolyngbya sp. CCNP1308]|uniref:hypothetical protein n=1 Tax=Leptolyngbya sp. CCNP1308 TaxID=3110255 RepID=UPI002B21CB99|nr:hypothetical protein [Leptolyngbya sp. CCNP1308]MEA5448353.1 hypothetical protein [Leptolyngbya sp. CCNP1308]